MGTTRDNKPGIEVLELGDCRGEVTQATGCQQWEPGNDDAATHDTLQCECLSWYQYFIYREKLRYWCIVAEELVLDARFNCGLPGSLVDISVLHPALHQSLSGSQDEWCMHPRMRKYPSPVLPRHWGDCPSPWHWPTITPVWSSAGGHSPSFQWTVSCSTPIGRMRASEVHDLLLLYYHNPNHHRHVPRHLVMIYN